MDLSKNRPLPIGKDDYKKIIDENCVYIDKTIFIKEFWESGGEVILITRPRRFGKSITLSMLRYFFEKTEKSTTYLFEKSKIWQEKEFRELQGAYPVISLSFKEVTEESWEEAYEQITEILVEELERVITPIADSLSPLHKRQYEALITQTASPIQFGNSLKFMSKVLNLHYNKKVIILIDEYDTPITYSYLNKKTISFMKKLFSAGLKGNPHLQKGLMTGVLRTAKDGILSGLNNPKICTMLDKNYSDKFGFTQKEVEELLQVANRLEKKEEVKSWYNGYIVGAEYLADPKTAHLAASVYNPWSILSYLEGSIFPKTYWANTGSTELLERLVAEADEKTQRELKLLVEGGSLENKQINQDVILLDLNKKDVEPWSFLFFAGYITTSAHIF